MDPAPSGGGMDGGTTDRGAEGRDDRRGDRRGDMGPPDAAGPARSVHAGGRRDHARPGHPDPVAVVTAARPRAARHRGLRFASAAVGPMVDARQRGVLRPRARPVPPGRRRRPADARLVRAAAGHPPRGPGLCGRAPRRRPRRRARAARPVADHLGVGRPHGSRGRRGVQRGRAGRRRGCQRDPRPAVAWAAAARAEPLRHAGAPLRRAALGRRAPPGDPRRPRPGPGAPRSQAAARAADLQPPRVADHRLDALRRVGGRAHPALLHPVRRTPRRLDGRRRRH